MPKFEPGHKRVGGRVKGTPNKDKVHASEVAARMGVEPLEVLLLFAKGDWRALGYEFGEMETQSGLRLTIEPAVRAKCAAEACQYIYPKKKAISISLTDMSDEELRQEVERRLAEKAIPIED